MSQTEAPSNALDERPSLLDIWVMRPFHAEVLATQAGVDLSTVRAMLCNQPVEQGHAQKVLAQLSILRQRDYTLSTVYVQLGDGSSTEPSA
jgi:hypothetical protein